MRRAAILALFLAAGCLRARGTLEEPVIMDVTLRGVTAVSKDDLLAGLATHASDRFFWGDAWRLDPDALAVDRRRVEAFYRERGYYAATVEAVELLPAGQGRVRVVIHVREGEPVRVTSVTVEGLDEAPEARAKAGKLQLQPGQIFTEARYDATRKQLAAALASTGYATAKVTQDVQVLPDALTAAVTYRIEAGARYRFGRLFVAGTAAVPREKVVAQAAREATTGEWFAEEKLERMQKRVFDLGVFAGVRVNRGEPDEPNGTIPVVLAVREAPFHTIRLGPGLGFEANRWEVMGQASWTHRNWLGGLRRLQLDAKAGYAWIPDPFSPTRKGLVGKLAAGFSQPGVLLGDRVDFQTSVEVEKTLEQAYASVEEKFRIGTPFRPAPRWTVAPTYNLEFYQLQDITAAPGEIPVQAQNCPSYNCVLSYFEQRVTWDGRDHPLVTTKGLWLSAAVQEGFHLGSQGYSFVKFIPEVRWFQPIAAGTVLAARAKLGALIPIGESGPAPVVALFTSGGAISMRGYGSERLSPMVYQDGEWIPTGGNGVLEGSVELRQELDGNLGGVLFLDGGNVSDASESPGGFRQVLNLSKLQLALGVGLRYKTPFGPFRVDVATRLPTDLSHGVPFEERFPPVPGNSGHREPIATLHITLGEAF